MATANVALAVKPRAWENQRRGKQLLAKYRHVECVPFGLLFSIYDNRWEQWGTAVIKFDSTGHVASIRIGFVPSDAPDFPLYWTVMGFHFEKSDKINVTTTQRATKGSSDTMPTP
jgi:hypothetical protein